MADPDSICTTQEANKEAITDGTTSSMAGGDGLLRNAIFLLTTGLAKNPAVVCAIASLLVLFFLIGVATSHDIERGMPQIFPAEHNQVAGSQAHRNFQEMPDLAEYRRPAATGTACDAGSTMNARNFSCVLNWCKATTAPVYGSDDGLSGSCWRGPTMSASHGPVGWGVKNCSKTIVRTRLAARERPERTAWQHMWTNVVRHMTTADSVSQPSEEPYVLPALVFQNWESGETATMPFFEMGEVTTELNWRPAASYKQDDCQISTVCFFGSQKCDLPGWLLLGQYSLAAPTAPPEAASRMLLSDEAVNTSEEGSTSADDAQSSEAINVSDQGFNALNSSLYNASNSSVEASNASSSTGEDTRNNTSASDAGHRATDTDMFPTGETVGLVVPTVPPTKRTRVSVMWGLLPAEQTPLLGDFEESYQFDSDFEPAHPWAQRAMYAMCTNLPKNVEIIQVDCWIAEFRRWLLEKGRRFPERDFHEQIVEWFGSNELAGTHLWMVDDKVRAARVQFDVNVAQGVSAETALLYMNRWDSFVEGRNTMASMTANHAWHTSDLWIRGEAEHAIVSSTVDTFLLSAVCGWLGACALTGDPWLACLVFCVVIGIVAGLVFVMVVVGWAIGPIEVISIVVFMGYAVTYSLHIVHSYNEVQKDDPELLKLLTASAAGADSNTLFGRVLRSLGAGQKQSTDKPEQLSPAELRVARTKLALLRLGVSTLSSAMSTVGSGVFLLFCTMTIFVKLGGAIVIVSLFSITFALVVLPAALMRVGPDPDPWYTRWIRHTAGELVRIMQEKLGLTKPSGWLLLAD
eukprot:gnl/TRDRNA2_/TRDRNA2_167136_c0_seq1.p1 gnl/TRDRNA2_/TRDRNA2_167136_c0~~gnl/TRDRNA2_/TRDRNA2_167136_c0_seq1.p1  ORF type:complete len:874 (-),score=122.21 gnl/TRDRNA2_/TRDRNA2_167136_c0_seq1:23-2434(-)